MPAKYHCVSPGVWDRRFSELSDAARVVAFYVWTCPARVTEGLFVLRPGHAAADTGKSVSEVIEALRELNRANIILYDPVAEMVLDTLALKTQPITMGTVKSGKNKGKPAPSNRLVHAVRIFLSLPPSPLKDEFLELAERDCPLLAAAIGKALDPSSAPLEAPSEPLVAPSSEAPSKSLPRGEIELEQEQEQERVLEPQPDRTSVTQVPHEAGGCATCGYRPAEWCQEHAA